MLRALARAGLPGALVALAAACKAGPAPPAAYDWHLTAAEGEVRVFRDASSLLDGFDAARPGAGVAAGDRALFGVCLLDGDERREWFVRLTALCDETKPDEPVEATPDAQRRADWRRLSGLIMTRVRIEVFDADLAPLADDEVPVLEALFYGAFGGCQEPQQSPTEDPIWIAEPMKEPEPVSFRVVGEWSVCMVLGIVRKSDALMGILREIARLPPLWTLLSGVSVGYNIALERAAPVTTSAGATAYTFPLRVLLNSSPALLCTVTAEEPVPPIRVCGGFTRLVACDPEDPERRVVLTLLAARRGDRAADTALVPAAGR